MSKAEYLTIFTAFIFGFAASEYLMGWGNIIRHRKQVKQHWMFVNYSVLTFLYLLVNWYTSFNKSDVIGNNLYYFFLAMISPALFYLISIYLFPRLEYDQKLDLETHFYENIRTISLLFVFFHASVLINYKVFQTVANQTDKYALASGTMLLFILVWIVNKKWLFNVSSFILWALLITWSTLLIIRNS